MKKSFWDSLSNQRENDLVIVGPRHKVISQKGKCDPCSFYFNDKASFGGNSAITDPVVRAEISEGVYKELKTAFN